MAADAVVLCKHHASDVPRYVLSDDSSELAAEVRKLRRDLEQLRAQMARPSAAAAASAEAADPPAASAAPPPTTAADPASVPAGDQDQEVKVVVMDREVVGSMTFTGIVYCGILPELGFGYVTPDDPGSLPIDVRMALAKQVTDADATGEPDIIDGADTLSFCKTDVNPAAGMLTAGDLVSFQVYSGCNGAGARGVSKTAPSTATGSVFSGPKTGGCGPGSMPASGINIEKTVVKTAEGAGSLASTETIQMVLKSPDGVGFGFIIPDDPGSLPSDVRRALAQQLKDAEASGESIEDAGTLTAGIQVTFLAYYDSGVCGASDVSVSR